MSPASGGARTHNLRLRRPTLYPVELRTRIARMVNLLIADVKRLGKAKLPLTRGTAQSTASPTNRSPRVRTMPLSTDN